MVIPVSASDPFADPGPFGVSRAGATALVDTGAEITILDRDFNLRTLGSIPISGKRLAVITPGGQATWADVHLLEIAVSSTSGVISRTFEAVVMPLGEAFHGGQLPSDQVNIILGMDFLNSCDFTYTVRAGGGALLAIANPEASSP
ncbi:MAG: aspartyl protease family protein [Chloroflexi bacterium]|nr:aspartyl protease family protein [Chloroflexota bacterium]